jgi:ABC-type glycerol-3-phosphate transport system substrate-binding protein
MKAGRLTRATIFVLSFVAISIGGTASAVFAAGAPTKSESFDELHEKAKKEGGKLNLYASLSGNSIDVILPAFQKRFPGVTVDHFDATGDKLIARIVAEGRGGRVIADAFVHCPDGRTKTAATAYHSRDCRLSNSFEK